MTAPELLKYIHDNPEKFVKLLQNVGVLPITGTLTVHLSFVPILKDDEGNPLDGSLLDSIVVFKQRILPNVYNESSFMLSEKEAIANFLDCSDANETVYKSIKDIISVL